MLISLHRISLAQFVVSTVLIGLLLDAVVVAQPPWGRQRRSRRERVVPRWEIDSEFSKDVFTFVRVRYDSYGGGWGGDWATDYPSSDQNFSFRLQQLTSLKVNPDPIYLRLTEEEIFNYPFLYMIEPGRLHFSEAEVVALRRFLNNGGFLMVDDFWGDEEYENFEFEIMRVFPERRPEEVPLDHEIFHNVYDLNEKPQIPAMQRAWANRDSGITWEPRYGSDTSVPHYRAMYDDEGRIMVFICHNTDLGDGWEREGENAWYFEEFSVKKAYPLGINIVVYAMTH